MKKTFILVTFGITAFAFAQKPMITRWKTSNDQDKQIAINNTGNASYTFEKVGDPSQRGSGTLPGGVKTLINLPSAGEYLVTILPTEDFALKMGYTSEVEAKELFEVLQWGDFRWDASISSMFLNCSNLQITATDVPDFSTVTDMSTMFYKCFALKEVPNINQWNTSNVTDMSRTFGYADQFNSDISNWNTSKVTSMFLMFAGYNTSVFNQDISRWDVSNVTNMQSMFRDNVAFNQDISRWNTAKVRDFSQMFSNAKAFDQSLGSWNLTSATNLSKMLSNSGLSCLNYSKTLQGWAGKETTPKSLTLTATGRIYGEGGKVYRDQLVNEKQWTISEDVYSAECKELLGTQEVQKSEPRLINPVTDILHIQTPEKIQSIEIYTMAGQQVLTLRGEARNLSSLPKGLYLLKVRMKNSVWTSKLMKN